MGRTGQCGASVSESCGSWWGRLQSVERLILLKPYALPSGRRRKSNKAKKNRRGELKELLRWIGLVVRQPLHDPGVIAVGTAHGHVHGAGVALPCRDADWFSDMRRAVRARDVQSVRLIRWRRSWRDPFHCGSSDAALGGNPSGWREAEERCGKATPAEVEIPAAVPGRWPSVFPPSNCDCRQLKAVGNRDSTSQAGCFVRFRRRSGFGFRITGGFWLSSRQS